MGRVTHIEGHEEVDIGLDSLKLGLGLEGLGDSRDGRLQVGLDRCQLQHMPMRKQT